MFTAILGILAPILGQVAKSIFPNPEDELKRMEMQTRLQQAIIEKSNEIEVAAAGIVKAEAESEHWLTANWRPLTMLAFVGLIIARWMGWTAPGMTEAEYLSLYDLMKIGLGGYVVGRSVEKVAPAIAAALGKK